MDQKQLSMWGLALAVCLHACAVQGVPSLTLESKCYYPQLLADQTFDDSAFITDITLYPEVAVNAALAGLGPDGRAVNFFLNTTSTCFKESGNSFVTDAFTGTEYGYKCACTTKRKLIVGVLEREQTCWVVNPLEQDIHYAPCGGFCKFGYGRIDTRTEGYHCIPRGRTRRAFLVYCQPGGQVDPYPLDPSRALAPGFFSVLDLVLPSYCGCRGYFCPQ